MFLKANFNLMVKKSMSKLTDKNFLEKSFLIVQFQKISIPPPRRELEIPGGWGGQRPGKFQRGGGVGGKIHFQMVGNRSTHFVRQKAPLTHYCRDVLKF